MLYRPLVALDADGLLVDFLEGALDAMHQVTGKAYHADEVTQWSPWLQHKLQPDECAEVFALIDTPGFCESLKVVPGAQEGVERLYEVADIVVVTAPWATSPTWSFERAKWLEQHFGIGEVIHAAGHYKRFVSADYFVDDHALNCRLWAECNSGKALLWSQPHNRNINDVPRVSGWDELINIVTKEASK